MNIPSLKSLALLLALALPCSPRAQRFTWNPDGTPNFGSPVPIDQPLPKPAR